MASLFQQRKGYWERGKTDSCGRDKTDFWGRPPPQFFGKISTYFLCELLKINPSWSLLLPLHLSFILV